jgi:hypothetical protein
MSIPEDPERVHLAKRLRVEWAPASPYVPNRSYTGSALEISFPPPRHAMGVLAGKRRRFRVYIASPHSRVIHHVIRSSVAREREKYLTPNIS